MSTENVLAQFKAAIEIQDPEAQESALLTVATLASSLTAAQKFEAFKEFLAANNQTWIYKLFFALDLGKYGDAGHTMRHEDGKLSYDMKVSLIDPDFLKGEEG